MENTFETIDQYIAQFPAAVQEKLQAIRQVIKEAAPEAVETIRYAMPTFQLHGNLVHFAAYPKHIGFYPAPAGILAFEDEIKAYRYAKGSVQFPLDTPLPLDLISRVTRFRYEENVRNHQNNTGKKKSS
ncbi:MAG: DUF1801 domain-containing protein [Saprospiraceae bacterium]